MAADKSLQPVATVSIWRRGGKVSGVAGGACLFPLITCLSPSPGGPGRHNGPGGLAGDAGRDDCISISGHSEEVAAFNVLPFHISVGRSAKLSCSWHGSCMQGWKEEGMKGGGGGG